MQQPADAMRMSTNRKVSCLLVCMCVCGGKGGEEGGVRSVWYNSIGSGYTTVGSVSFGARGGGGGNGGGMGE